MKFKAEYFHDEKRDEWFAILICTLADGSQTAFEVRCRSRDHTYAVMRAYTAF